MAMFGCTFQVCPLSARFLPVLITTPAARMALAAGLCALSTAMLVGPAARPVALRARATRRACPAIFMAEPAPKPLKMSEKLALVAEELGLELDGLKVATAVAAGNKAVGIEGEGPLGAQMQRLLKELGLGKAREEAEAKAEEEGGGAAVTRNSAGGRPYEKIVRSAGPKP